MTHDEQHLHDAQIAEVEDTLDQVRSERDKYRKAAVEQSRRLRTSLTFGLVLMILSIGTIGGVVANRESVADLTKITTYQQRSADANACRQRASWQKDIAFDRAVLLRQQEGTPEYAAAVLEYREAVDLLQKVVDGKLCPVPKP